jgi:replicative DNA helicase
MKTELLPNNEEAERSICAALHLDGHRAFRECLNLELAADDFYLPLARTYWQAFSAFMVDHPHAESDDVGACQWLRDGTLPWENYQWLTAPVPTWLQMVECVREVRRLSFRRRLIAGAAQVGELARTSPDELPAAVTALSKLPIMPTRPQTFRQLADSQAESVRNPQPEHFLRLVHWPWQNLDRDFKPFSPGDLVVLAARPSVGKSSLARQFALSTAQAGQSVYFSSLEVGGPDFFDALTVALAGSPKAARAEYLEAVARLRSLPIAFDADFRSLAAITAAAAATRERSGLDLLVIDYLGLLADCVPARGQNKTQAVGEAAGACKRLARDLGCVVLLLVQLNRNVVSERREPGLADLRDSGEIEAHADRVLLLHQPETFSLGDGPAEKQSVHDPIAGRPRWFTQVFQEKGRTVGTAAGALWFNRSLARFELIATLSHEDQIKSF